MNEIRQYNLFCPCGSTEIDYFSRPALGKKYFEKRKSVICLRCGRNMWSMDNSKSAFDIAMENRNKSSEDGKF